MKKDQVAIGGVYLAKVSNSVVAVRIDAENRHGGWDATNLATNMKVRIKTAQRLRSVSPGHAIAQSQEDSSACATESTPANAHAVPAEVTTSAKPAKAKKVSGLDAACEVLKAKGEPMTCGAIVDEMLAKGMWETGGKTPAATIYAAIVREISTKGAASRFRKTGRGLFAINAKGG